MGIERVPAVYHPLKALAYDQGNGLVVDYRQAAHHYIHATTER